MYTFKKWTFDSFTVESNVAYLFLAGKHAGNVLEKDLQQFLLKFAKI